MNVARSDDFVDANSNKIEGIIIDVSRNTGLIMGNSTCISSNTNNINKKSPMIDPGDDIGLAGEGARPGGDEHRAGRQRPRAGAA